MSEAKVEQSAEAMLGKCPVCGKLRVEVANGTTDCGHSIYSGRSSSSAKRDVDRYIHAKSADEQIHFGRKLRLPGYEDL